MARAGVIKTAHGVIETPAFVAVGTKATVKALTPREIADCGANVVLANTYHLYLEPGIEILKSAGGLGKFMGWGGPTMTDSGGFQIFSLSGKNRGLKVSSKSGESLEDGEESKTAGGGRSENLVKVSEDGVKFRSFIDGSEHFFTPEKSIEIQNAIGADIIFAFDHFEYPDAPYDKHEASLERTSRWAKRCLERHSAALEKKEAPEDQALFGIVQGGRHEALRKRSAREIAGLEFSGFGIGGSFDKEDMGTAVRWVNEILPEDKPRHLLGIGEPQDIVEAVKNGCDTFDCVAPTRAGRTGTLYTSKGKINIKNAAFRNSFERIDPACDCYTCSNFTRAYLSHLYRNGEMLAGVLGTIHNLKYIIGVTKSLRESILKGDESIFSN